MLKEADLSIGIRSREILQVRNTCDIIVSSFTQITDLILVHGTWNLHRITTIAMFSIYACSVIIFPYYIENRVIEFGSCFPDTSYLTLMLQLLVINISLIVIICFDQNVERSVIGVSPKVYSENYTMKYDNFYKFTLELIKGIIDSLIIYYGINYSMTYPVNSIGEVADKLLIETSITFSAYLIIYFKLLFCYMNIINIFVVITALISYVALISI